MQKDQEVEMLKQQLMAPRADTIKCASPRAESVPIKVHRQPTAAEAAEQAQSILTKLVMLQEFDGSFVMPSLLDFFLLCGCGRAATARDAIGVPEILQVQFSGKLAARLTIRFKLKLT